VSNTKKNENKFFVHVDSGLPYFQTLQTLGFESCLQIQYVDVAGTVIGRPDHPGIISPQTAPQPVNDASTQIVKDDSASKIFLPDK
jgi:hypothetical protein